MRTSRVHSRSAAMPIFIYFVVVSSVLIALLFVADATLEKGSRAVVTSERVGLKVMSALPPKADIDRWIGMSALGQKRTLARNKRSFVRLESGLSQKIQHGQISEAYGITFASSDVTHDEQR